MFWPNHEKVFSTIHLLDSTLKPLGGMSLCQSTSLPSLAHFFKPILSPLFPGPASGDDVLPPCSSLELFQPIVCHRLRSLHPTSGALSAQSYSVLLLAEAVIHLALGPWRYIS